MVHEQAYLDQDHGSQAMNTLSELWKKQTLCDATVQAGPYKIKVHKTVLMVASPTLLALCHNGRQEGHLQVQLPINLRGLDALHCFITYLYEGLLNLTEECVMEVLNIASYLQVEVVVKFCLSFLDSAKERNVTLKAALSSPYDTCLYKVLNESLSKTSEPAVIKNSSWSNPPEPAVIKNSSWSNPPEPAMIKNASWSNPPEPAKTKALHKTTCLSPESTIVIPKTKEKGFFVENFNFKSHTLSSPQTRETSSSQTVSEVSNEARQLKYDLTEDDTKPDIEPHNSTAEHFGVQEMPQTYTFPQNDSDSPPPDSQITKVKSIDDKRASVSINSDMDHDNQSSQLMDQVWEDAQNPADYTYKLSPSNEVSRQVHVITLDENDSDTEEVLSIWEASMPCSSNDTTPSMVKPNQQPTAVDLVVCPTCGKTFSTKGNLKTHQRKHEGTLVNCPQCPRKFFSQSHLNEHLKIHNGEMYTCIHCSKEFFTKCGMKLHQMSHEGRFKMKCNVCGRGFNSRTDFDAHQNMHHDTRPHKCDQCGKCFYSKQYLKKHLRICVILLKNFQCAVCNKKFKEQSTFEKHMSSHDQQNECECLTCGVTFNSPTALKHHSKTHQLL